MSTKTTRTEKTSGRIQGEEYPVLFVSDPDSEEYGAYLPAPVYYDKKGKGLEIVEIAGLYWHFVDLVWVFIFAFFYLW